jgi:hypothetical protein
MTGAEFYDVWAPSSAVWSPWVKPVLFAYLGNNQVSPYFEGDKIDPEQIVNWLRPADGTEALVLDVPGKLAIAAGVELVRKGYRPVALFNGNPNPGGNAVRDMEPLIDALIVGTGKLRHAQIAPNAPPAFLLDCHRLEGVPSPGRFDNRWVTVPQDFPSALKLAAHGIRTIQIIRAKPMDDLAHVLLRWQEGGLRLLAREPPYASATALTVERPSRFRSLWYRVLVASGLRRNSAGGFGSVVPDPETAGGGFG